MLCLFHSLTTDVKWVFVEKLRLMISKGILLESQVEHVVETY